MEISEEADKCIEPFAEKHNLYVIFHNHGHPRDPNFSFDKVLAYGPKLMLNLDCGHYFGTTGLNPCDIELEYTISDGSDAVKEVTRGVEYCHVALSQIRK